MARAIITLAGALLALAAVPAGADVKAGWDAWQRGDYRSAVEEWRGPAIAGDADAQFNLGQAYKLGRGVPVDPGLGLAEVEELDLLAVRPGGVVVNVSIWGHRAELDIQRLVLKEVDLRGTIGYAGDHPATIRLVQEGRVDLAPFITHRIGLDELVDVGYDTLLHRTEEAVKILVSPRR